MDVKPIVKQEKPATYTELGVIKVGSGLFIDNGGTLSIGYEVTATAGTGGSITPAGTTHVQAGGEITLTITPDENYRIDTVTINGVQEATPANEYTFADLSENKTIIVTFKYMMILFENSLKIDVLTRASPAGTVNYSVDNDKLSISCNYGNHADGTIYTTDKLDVTNYNKLCAKLESSSGTNEHIAEFLVYNDSFGGLAMKRSNTTGIQELDISNITGSHYIGIGIHTNGGTSTAVYSKWWLE